MLVSGSLIKNAYSLLVNISAEGQLIHSKNEFAKRNKNKNHKNGKENFKKMLKKMLESNDFPSFTHTQTMIVLIRLKSKMCMLIK